MHLSAQAAPRKDHTGWLNNRISFSHSSRSWKSPVEVLERSVSSEDPLPGSHTAVFLGGPCTPFSRYMCVQEMASGVSSHRVIKPIRSGPGLRPPLTLVTSLKGPSPNIITLEMRASTQEFRARAHTHTAALLLLSFLCCIPILSGGPGPRVQDCPPAQGGPAVSPPLPAESRSGPTGCSPEDVSGAWFKD